MLVRAKQVEAGGDHLKDDEGDHHGDHPAEAAEGVHSAEETRKHGDQEIGLAVSDTNRIEPGQHDDAGDRAHDAGERINQHDGPVRVDARIAGSLGVRADHVGCEAETRSLQQDGPQRHAGHEDEKRDRNAENRTLTHVNDEGREAGDIAAAGQELAEPAQEDHHRQGYENRMRARIGDDNTHGAADDRPG